MKNIPNFVIGFVCVVLVIIAVSGYIFVFQKKSGINTNTFLDSVSCESFINLREAIKTPTRVCTLDIQKQKLTGALPGEIRFMVNLTTLNVSNNLMTGIPAEIGQLKRVKKIDYSANQLDTMPNEIASLTKLQFLSLANNKYRELPESVTQIVSLVILDLSYNSITSLPVSIGNLKNLEELRLVGNPLPSKEIEKVQQLLPHVRIIK